MLASVLNSERAVRISVRIAETFIRLRHMVASQAELMKKLSELEGRLDQHDGAIQGIIDALRNLMAPPEEPRPRIGFLPGQT